MMRTLHKRLLGLLSAGCICLCTTAQIFYSAEITGVASSGTHAPFWLQTNRYGSISSEPYSGLLQLSMGKTMYEGTSPNRFSEITRSDLFSYGFGLTMAGQADSHVRLLPQEYYVQGRIWLFDATVGACAQIWGNQDADLSSGGLLFSGNTRPMPRITLGISQYRAVPYTRGFLEIQGGITHGWYLDDIYIKKALLHHKFAGLRVGGRWPVNLSYEFHHAAQWGGISPVYGQLGHSLSDFLTIFRAQAGGSMANDQLNAEGNHIVSQCIGLDAKGNGWKVHTYWQQIAEDGPIRAPWRAMNIADGLWGISAEQTYWPYLSKVLIEYLNTTDQSGSQHDIDGLVFGGADSYYINSIYQNGWNYYLRTMGTPFITSPIYNKNGECYTQNNRVQLFHAALMGSAGGYRYRCMLSHSRNYGTYFDTEIDQLRRNTSLMVEVQKHFEKLWKLDFSVTFGGDFGQMWGNSAGLMLSIRRYGLIGRK